MRLQASAGSGAVHLEVRAAGDVVAGSRVEGLPGRGLRAVAAAAVLRRGQCGRHRELGHEGVLTARVVALLGAARHGKVAGRGIARDVGVAAAVQGDGPPAVVAATAQVGAVDQAAARGVQLGHEGVVVPIGRGGLTLRARARN